MKLRIVVQSSEYIDKQKKNFGNDTYESKDMGLTR